MCLQHFVFPMQCRQVFLFHFGIGNFPRRCIRIENGTEIKCIQRFVKPSTAGIFRRCHIFMMALVVLNKKVHVQARH